MCHLLPLLEQELQQAHSRRECVVGRRLNDHVVATIGRCGWDSTVDLKVWLEAFVDPALDGNITLELKLLMTACHGRVCWLLANKTFCAQS